MPPPLPEEVISSKRAALKQNLQNVEIMVAAGDTPVELQKLCTIIITDGKNLAAAAPHINLTHQVEMSHILAIAYNTRGVCLMQTGDYGSALIDLTNAISCNQHHKTHYAATLAQRGETSYPDYQVPYKNRIYCYEQLGYYGEAAEDKQTIARLFSNFEPNWVTTGELDEAMKSAPPPPIAPSPPAPIYSNKHAASAMLPVIQEPRPLTGDEAYEQGRKYFKEEKYRKAVPYFTLAIEGEANLTNAYYRRAYSQFQLKHYEQAASDIKILKENVPSLSNHWIVTTLLPMAEAKLKKNWMTPLTPSPRISQPMPSAAAAASAAPANSGAWAAKPPRAPQRAPVHESRDSSHTSMLLRQAQQQKMDQNAL